MEIADEKKEKRRVAGVEIGALQAVLRPTLKISSDRYHSLAVRKGGLGGEHDTG
jgi:hypothetical protein